MNAVYDPGVQCPGCAAALDDRTVLGRHARVCGGCGGIWIGRPDVLALRQVSPAEHPLLGLRSGATAPAAAVGGTALRACPACAGRMHGFAFAGGNTRVEACDACDHVFLERGELAAIADEAHHGIAMSEAARQGLHAHRLESTWARMSGTELAIVVAGVLALYLFVRIVHDLGPTSITVVVGAVVALGLFVFWRRKLRNEHAEASARLGRLMDAEEYRLASASSAAAPAGEREERPRAAPRACPFCGAALPPQVSHCTACDSDFGPAAP
ncbi:MAG: zf-TFIIB domain-containing protein [Polyangiaceae bacterium]